MQLLSPKVGASNREYSQAGEAITKMQVGERLNESLSFLDELDLGAEDERTKKTKHQAGHIEEERSRAANERPKHLDYVSSDCIDNYDVVTREADDLRPHDAGVSNDDANAGPVARNSNESSDSDSSTDDDNETSTNVTTLTARRRRVSLTTLIENQEGAHILERIQSHPLCLRHQRDITLNGRRTRAHPLHHAVSMKPPIKLVEAMLQVFPDACRLSDDMFGQLPLHIACNFRASSGVVRRLLESFPEAVRVKDVDKRVPLHYSCHDGFPNNVSLLLLADKSMLEARDASGKTPVDLLRESQSPRRDAILRYIYEISSNEPGVTAPTKPRFNLKPRYLATSDYEVPVLPYRLDSPSASGMTKDDSMKSTKKPKAMPRGRTATSDRAMPQKRGSSLEMPQRHDMMYHHSTKRASSLERIISRWESFDSFMTSRGDSTSSDTSSHETDEMPVMRIEFKGPDLANVSQRQKKKARNPEDALPCLESSSTNSSEQSNEPMMSNEAVKTSPTELQNVAPHSECRTNTHVDGNKDTNAEAERRRLELRKAALVEECNRVNGTLRTREKKVEMRKSKLFRLESQIRELQKALAKEKQALDVEECGATLYREMLVEHQEKIKAVDQQLETL